MTDLSTRGPADGFLLKDMTDLRDLSFDMPLDADTMLDMLPHDSPAFLLISVLSWTTALGRCGRGWRRALHASTTARRA